eukprot:3140312-Amphidinium_carterae.1
MQTIISRTRLLVQIFDDDAGEGMKGELLGEVHLSGKATAHMCLSLKLHQISRVGYTSATDYDIYVRWKDGTALPQGSCFETRAAIGAKIWPSNFCALHVFVQHTYKLDWSISETCRSAFHQSNDLMIQESAG